MVAWKTIFIIVAALILIVVVLFFIFGIFDMFKPKYDVLIQMLEDAIGSIFDIADWPFWGG